MSLKALKADIQRATAEARERFDRTLAVILVGVVSARRGDTQLSCAGWMCQYMIAGSIRRLFFIGTSSAAERTARSLIDHADSIERTPGTRPAAVLVHQITPPDDAVLIAPPSAGLTTQEHAARLYDVLRSS